MIHKKAVLFPLCLVFLLFAGLCLVFAQNRMTTSTAELLGMGIGLYADSRFTESITVLRLIPPGDPSYPDALYWASLAGISAGHYEQALQDLEILEATRSRWTYEIPYHRGRCLFYLGRYEEALVSFGRHQESPTTDDSGKAASWYWMGESLFAMGRLDSAANAFSQVVVNYPYSVKFQAASYRLDMITQKKIEEELLAILRWSHEESLRSLEEYQTRETIYNQAIAAYERRIQEMLAGGGSGEPEDYRSYFAAEMRIAALEASLAEANAALEVLRGGGNNGTVYGNNDTAQDNNGAGNEDKSEYYAERAKRIQELRESVIELSNRLNNSLAGEQK